MVQFTNVACYTIVLLPPGEFILVPEWFTDSRYLGVGLVAMFGTAAIC